MDTGPVRTGLDHPEMPTTERPRRTYPLKWVIVALGITALLLIGGPYLYFNVIEGKSPAKLQLPHVAGAPVGIVPGPVSGTWSVASGSEAGYRVREILFGQSHTAVGRTPKVTGTVVISGSEVTGAGFSVAISTIHSDQGARDYQFRTFIMESYDFPTAKFQLTEPIQLGSVPAIGEKIDRQATGDLTMHGVTRLVTFTLSAERLAGAIYVNAEIPVVFHLWHIPNPSFAVAQLGNSGTIEVLLHLMPAK